MTVSERIFCLLDKINKKQKDLSEYTGIPTSTISAWKRKNSSPSAESISIIADFFEVSVDFLLTGKNVSPIKLTKEEKELLKHFHNLPQDQQQRLIGVTKYLSEEVILQGVASDNKNAYKIKTIDIFYNANFKVSAGLGDELPDYNQWDKVQVPETEESKKADFILTVDGDSMYPMFNPKDLILVRQQPYIDDNQIGIFAYNGKGYVKKKVGNRLISLNPKYKDIIICNENHKCFGIVLGTTEIIK